MAAPAAMRPAKTAAPWSVKTSIDQIRAIVVIWSRLVRRDATTHPTFWADLTKRQTSITLSVAVPFEQALTEHASTGFPQMRARRTRCRARSVTTAGLIAIFVTPLTHDGSDASRKRGEAP